MHIFLHIIQFVHLKKKCEHDIAFKAFLSITLCHAACHFVSFSLQLSLSCLMKYSAIDVCFGLSCIVKSGNLPPRLTPKMPDLGLNPQHNRNGLVFHFENTSWDSTVQKGQRVCTEGVRMLCTTLRCPCSLIWWSDELFI